MGDIKPREAYERHYPTSDVYPTDADGKIDVLVVGFRGRDGQIHLMASRDVPMATISAEAVWLDDSAWGCSNPEPPPPVHYRLTAEMVEQVWAAADDYPTALRRITDAWAEEGRVPSDSEPTP